MIYRLEYDKISDKYITEKINYNNGKIDLLSKFLVKNIKIRDNLSAMRQLELLEIEK